MVGFAVCSVVEMQLAVLTETETEKRIAEPGEMLAVTKQTEGVAELEHRMGYGSIELRVHSVERAECQMDSMTPEKGARQIAVPAEQRERQAVD